MQTRFALSLVFAVSFLGGCQPSVGDHCIQSTDCSATGDRLCDTSQPNGYCTIFNCQPNRCPGGSGCMETNAAIFGCEYDDRHAPSRLSRQMCLKTCHNDTDCRLDQGYACIVPKQYGVLVLDNDQTEKVCLPLTTYNVGDAASEAEAPVCSVSGPDAAAFDAGVGYQGDAGTDSSAPDAGDAGAEAAADAASD
jgi:hypothetical protein